ncbi:MAG TPA: hypothetical protein VGL03_09220 [Thermoanaerobaculia bacterium]
MEEELPRDLVVRWIFANPRRVEHARVGSKLVEGAHADLRDRRCQEDQVTRRVPAGNQRQEDPADGVRHHDDVVGCATISQGGGDHVSVAGRARVGLVGRESTVSASSSRRSSSDTRSFQPAEDWALP